VHFGNGTLDKGYSKGGMRSDVIIPSLSINTDASPWEFSFAWKELFTRLFTKELVMRAFRDKLLKCFVPTLREDVEPRIEKAAIYHYLRKHFH